MGLLCSGLYGGCLQALQNKLLVLCDLAQLADLLFFLPSLFSYLLSLLFLERQPLFL